jgi:hypothetical protein
LVTAISTRGRYKADFIRKIEGDGFFLEHDMTPQFECLLGEKQLCVGAVDVQDPNIEIGEQLLRS